MPLRPKSLRSGQCYLIDTPAGPRVCQITAIFWNESLKYRHRPAYGTPPARWPLARTSLQAFAALAAREVPCDWTLDADEGGR